MKFEKTPPTWNAEGSEPPSSLKTSGFQAGYKPPAAYFNWFWNKVSACLTELQTKLSNVDNTKDADKSVKYASTSGSANKTKGSMVVRLDGGSTEGTDLFTFDGSTGKSVNITPAKIGAAPEGKMPFWATYGTTTNAEIEAAYQAGKQVLVKTTDGYVGELFARLSSGKAHFFCAGVKIYRCFNGSWTDLSDSYGFTPTVHASTHKTGGSDPIKPEDIGAAAASNGTVLSQNADYAEVGQWADGNPNSENRIGYFVATDDTQAGTTIIKATSTKDVRGVVVTAPAFSGNCSADKFDSNGNLLKQYAYVAVMGLVSVIDNGTCTINERCMPNDSGTAVPSSNNLGYQVIDRIDDTHILIAVEPGADMIQRIRTDVAGLQNDVANRVRYDVAQSLTDTQKAQAQTNIGVDAISTKNIGSVSKSLNASELQAYLDSLPRLLTENHVITLNGTYSQGINIEGFYGCGSITLRAAAVGDCVFHNCAKVTNCAVPVVFQKIKWQEPVETLSTGQSYVTVTSAQVFLDNCVLIGSKNNGSQRPGGVSTQRFGALYTENCVFKTLTFCAQTYFGGYVELLTSQDGTLFEDNYMGVSTFYGGIILLTNKTPDTPGSTWNTRNGGLLVSASGKVI